MPVFDKREIVRWSTIDLSDAYVAFKRRWFLGDNGYAYARHNGRTMPMHRVLLWGQIGSGRVVDHINRNKLDNRRANLRIVTPQRNGQNTGGRSTWRGRPASSSYRGVVWRERDKKWRAVARYAGKQYNLGAYDVELDAARVVQQFWATHGIAYSLD